MKSSTRVAHAARVVLMVLMLAACGGETASGPVGPAVDTAPVGTSVATTAPVVTGVPSEAPTPVSMPDATPPPPTGTPTPEVDPPAQTPTPQLVEATEVPLPSPTVQVPVTGSQPVQVANGAEVYTLNCARCHAENGLGTAQYGATLIGVGGQYSREAMMAELTSGHPVTFGFADRLTADEIASVVAYVKATFP